MARIPYDPYDQEFEDKAAGPSLWSQPFGSLQKNRLDTEPDKPKPASDVIYGHMNNPDYRGEPQRSESFFASANQEKQESGADDFYPSMRKRQSEPVEPATRPGDRTSTTTHRAAPNQYASLAGPQSWPGTDHSPEGTMLARAGGGKAPAPGLAPARTVNPTPAQSPAPVKKPVRATEPETAINPAFLARIWQLENPRATEEQANKAFADNKAVGKYQLTTIGLQTIDYLDAHGNWTKKAADRGIRDYDDLRKNPEAQAVAVREYFDKMEGYVRKTGAHLQLGHDVEGKIAKFPITEAGLMAAAHKEGQQVVKYYLEHQQRKGWKSGNFDNVDEDIEKNILELDPRDKRPAKDRFLAVETRLRELAGTPYRLWLDH